MKVNNVYVEILLFLPNRIMQYSCLHFNNCLEVRQDRWECKHSEWNDWEIKKLFNFIMCFSMEVKE